MKDLDIDSGETYTVNKGDTELYNSANVDGELQVNGTLILDDEARSDQIIFKKENKFQEIVKVLSTLGILLYATLKSSNPINILSFSFLLIVGIYSLLYEVNLSLFLIVAVMHIIIMILTETSK